MIGKIQRLKNKKGFTIVELLIVIAIIGVLAAILIPLMSDYLTKARVTSAKAAASSYKTQIAAFLTDCAMSGDGRKETTDVAYFDIIVSSTGTHSVTLTANDYTKWNKRTDNNSITDELTTQLNDTIKDVKNASIRVSLIKNACVAVVFTPDSTVSLSTYFKSDGTIQNINSDGIGTDGSVLGSK